MIPANQPNQGGYMFQAASCAPTDGRPVLWLYGDGSGGDVMFCRHECWWLLTQDFDVTSDFPYETVEGMMSSDWLWIDLPHSVLARTMITAVPQIIEIDRARDEKIGYYLSR